MNSLKIGQIVSTSKGIGTILRQDVAVKHAKRDEEEDSIKTIYYIDFTDKSKNHWFFAKELS